MNKSRSTIITILGVAPIGLGKLAVVYIFKH